MDEEPPEEMQQSLYANAKKFLEKNTVEARTFEELKKLAEEIKNKN